MRGTRLILLMTLLTPLIGQAQNSTNRCRELVRAQGTLPGTNRPPISFRVQSTLRQGVTKGKVAYRDRAAGINFRSAELLEYQVLDEASRLLKFAAADTNGNPVTGTFLVCDFGTGTNDIVGAVIDGGYEVTSAIKRGKIVIRRKNCPEL